MMQGTLINDNGVWQIKTESISIDVHRSCLLELTEDLNGKTVDYVTLKDFTSNKQGIQYVLPILQDPDSYFFPTNSNRNKESD